MIRQTNLSRNENESKKLLLLIFYSPISICHARLHSPYSPYQLEQIGAFFRVAECFALVAREFHAVVPFSFLGDPAAGEFHDDIHGLGILHIASEKRAHTVGIFHAPAHVSVYLDGPLDVESVGKHHLLGRRIDAH